jgi:hypothetical protein
LVDPYHFLDKENRKGIDSGPNENQKTTMKYLILLQIAVSLFGALFVLIFNTPQNAGSFLSGAMLIALNMYLLDLSWGQVLKKKLVAMSFLIIVFKYALLTGLVYLLAHSRMINLVWMVAGLSSLVLTGLLGAFIHRLKVENQS